jgi:hypothetical protein
MGMAPIVYDKFAGMMSGRRPWNVVGGGPIRCRTETSFRTTPPPSRSGRGIGLSGPGTSGLAGYPQYLYRLTIDAPYQDAAEWLQHVGASEALNLEWGRFDYYGVHRRGNLRKERSSANERAP